MGPGLEMVVLTGLAKRPADRYQSATTMAQHLERVAGHHTAAAVPPAAGTADPTVTVPTAVAPRPPTLAMPPLDVARRLGWIRWVLAGGLGVVAVLVVALWPRGDNPPTGPRSTGPAALTAAPTTAPAPSPRPQVGLTLALATLTEALTSGQQQGLVDPAAQDLLKQAQEATRAVKKGKADEQQKKLQDLERKTDELIEKGKSGALPPVRCARQSPSSEVPHSARSSTPRIHGSRDHHATTCLSEWRSNRPRGC